MPSHRFLLSLVLLGTLGSAQAQAQTRQTLQLRGSAVAAQPLTAAAAELKKDLGIDFRIITEGGSSPAIRDIQLDGIIDMALSTRPMTGEERASHPEKTFVETRIGLQAVLFVVPDEIWNSGIRSLTKAQIKHIYERDYTNWKQVGGESREIKFFSRDPERGIWDVFALWAYEDIRKAPRPKFEILNDAADVVSAIKFNAGSISMLEFGAVATDRVHPLAIKLDDDTVVEPTVVNIASGKYPMVRPLILITSRAPTGKLKELVEFMKSDAGQAYVKKLGFVTNAELATGEAPP